MKHLALVFVLLLLCLPVFAQDATAEATLESTPNTPVQIVAEDGATVIVSPDEAEQPAANDGSLWGLVLVVGSGFVGVMVAISFGLQAVGNRAAAASSNPLEVAVLEKAHDSVPQIVVATMIQPLKESLERSDDALKKVIDLLNKITDRIPESEKPSPIAPDTSTVSTHTLVSPATQTPSEG